MARRKAKRKKRSSKKWWIIPPLMVIAIAGATYWWYKTTYIKATRFAHYDGFGIDLPANYSIHGIDVSWYQGNVDWNRVKQMQAKNVKIGFAFIKATEGADNVDKKFKRNWLKATEANVTKGAYHYFVAARSGKLQAQNFINTVSLKAGDLPPVLDIENLCGTKPAQMRKEIKDWLTIVERHYGVRPIIYTYVSFYSSFLDKEFGSYPLWAAHYHDAQKPRIQRQWLFWQHSESGRVNGIKQPVDFNVFNGDSLQFAQLLIAQKEADVTQAKKSKRNLY